MKSQKKLYAAYRKWRSFGLLEEDGIVVGADLTQEWLLPWWWNHYQRFNSLAVTFVDFGMSLAMRTWCQERGELIRLLVADIFVTDKQEIDAPLIQQWEDIHGRKFWPSRNAWFKKPLACLQTPYRRSIWIDLDCEIRGPLTHLFDLCEHPSGISIAKELHELPTEKISYNSGVIIYKRGLSLLEEWADRSMEQNYAFAGDQNVLSRILREKDMQVSELPLIYNWSRCSEENPQAVILHWHGVHGKSVIAHQMTRANWESLSGYTDDDSIG